MLLELFLRRNSERTELISSNTTLFRPSYWTNEEHMMRISGSLWLGGRKPVRTSISVGAQGKTGILLASTGVRPGGSYLFKTDDGRLGKLRVVQISSPGVADFVFEERLRTRLVVGRPQRSS